MPYLNRVAPVSWNIRASETRSAERLLEIDAETFRSHFNRKPFLFRHNLSRHPLFDLDRLAALAKDNLRRVDYNAGNVPVSLPDWQLTPQNGLSAEETIRRIEQCASWMVLKRVEFDPRQRSLLDLCLNEIAPLSEPIEPGMFEREGSIFVASPGSVTPYHMDHEINFLLQIRGSKMISVFSAEDREVLAEQDLEEYFAGSTIYRNMLFPEKHQNRAMLFELKEGYGIHIPTTYPHWVRNGDNVSISYSVSFKTPASLRRGGIYRVNAGLRKMGLHPSPYGQSRFRDSVKYLALRALNRTQQWLGKAPAND